MSNLLSREQFLKNRPQVNETVSALGGQVKLKAMSACEKDMFEQRWLELKDRVGDAEIPNIRAFFVIHHVVDEDNKLMFTIDDLEAVGNQSGLEIDKLFVAAQRLSGLSDDDEVDLKKS